MSFFLALDQGTTSSRAIVFDGASRICGKAQQAFRQIYPQPGWVEHDVMELWETQLACAREAIADAGLQAQDITALGITNQRETTLIWERATGRPIHNAIVWQDRRTADWCAQQRAKGLTAIVQAKTGLVIDPYFSASKIVWLLDHVPDARARAVRGELAFGTIDTWLIWQLNQGQCHATDVSNASRTMLFDIHANEWSEELLQAFDIPRALLPKVLPSAAAYGETAAELFGAPMAIRGVAGDQQAALYGQGCTAPGMVKNTYGTGCFMLMHTGSECPVSTHGLIATRVAQVDQRHEYAIEGSVFSAGSAIQWLRDELHLIDQACDIDSLAMSVPDTGGVVLVPAFNGLGAPYWNADARGALLGITRGTGRGHIARAVLEAIALQSTELLHAMQSDTGLNIEALRVDGGATASGLLMQIQADLLGIPVQRAHVQETTALGAARLAGLAESTNVVWQADIFIPQASRDWVEAKLDVWRRAVQRSLDWG